MNRQTVINFSALFLIAYITLLLGAAQPAHATTTLPLSLEQVIDRSGLITMGSVVDVSVDEERLLTEYRLCELVVIAGEHDEACITFSVPGTHTVSLAGMPKLSVGQTAIIFLRDAARYNSPFVGWGQGVYLIETANDGTQRVRRYDRPDTSCIAIPGPAAMAPTGGSEDSRLDGGAGSADRLGPDVAPSVQAVPDTSTAGCALPTLEAFVADLQVLLSNRASAGRSLPEGLPASWEPVLIPRAR